MKFQGGGFALGLVVGLLVGLALALGVAVYITKVPVPFVDKVPQRTAEQDSAEAARNRHWDPNAPLATRPAPRPPAAAASPAAPEATVGAAPIGGGASAPARDPAAILAGRAPATVPVVPATDPFVYLVQAGAFARAEDAEQQRARLAMLGLEARVTEREQAGRTVYRVRIGPFDTRADADAMQARLQGAGVEGQLVRVERP